MMYCRKRNKEKEERKGGRVSWGKEEKRKKEERKKKKEKEEKGSYLETGKASCVTFLFLDFYFIFLIN